MKRWFLRILVFLLLGAIVNVAVAWGIGATLRHPVWSEERTFESADRTPRWVLREYIQRCSIRVVWNFHGTWPTGDDTALQARPLGSNEYSLQPSAYPPSWSKVGWRRGPQHSGFESNDIILECACGWPTLSTRALVVTRERLFQPWVNGDIAVEAVRSDGILLDDRSAVLMFAYRILPYRPIWPGFAIDAVFYAFVLWLLFAAPFALRRWRRIKRGLCPKCAYPVGDSPVCTECGAAVNRIAR